MNAIGNMNFPDIGGGNTIASLNIDHELSGALLDLYNRDVVIKSCAALISDYIFSTTGGLHAIEAIHSPADTDKQGTTTTNKRKRDDGTETPDAAWNERRSLPSSSSSSSSSSRGNEDTTPSRKGGQLSMVPPTSARIIEESIDGMQPTSDDFSDYVRGYLEPFLKDALVHLFVFGYFVWTTNEDVDPSTGRPLRFPVLVPDGLYWLRVSTNSKYEVSWHAYSTNSSGASVGNLPGPDPLLRVYVLNGEHPDTITGQFRSRVAPLLKHAEFVDALMRNMVQADTTRSHPTVVLEFGEDTHGSLNNVDEMYADVDLLRRVGDDSRAREMQTLSRLHQEGGRMDSMKRQMAGTSGLHKIPVSTHGSSGVDGSFDYRSPAQDNLFIVPPGLNMSSHQLPKAETSENPLLWDTQRLEHICESFSIPNALMHTGNQSRIQAANKADSSDFRQFSRTVKRWRKELLLCVSAVFYDIHGEGATSVRFHINSVPYMDTLTIFHLVDQDIMKREAARKYISEMHGFEPADLLEGGQKNEHYRPPIWGTERGTDSFIQGQAADLKSKAQVQRAEAQRVAAEVGNVKAQAQEHAAKARALRTQGVTSGGSAARTQN